MKPVHFKHWTESHKAALQGSASLADLFHIARDVTRCMPAGIHMVSGPITTGGVGTIDGNMKVFSGAIELLCEEGVNIFSQAPFEDKMREFFERWVKCNPPGAYCQPIIDEFYMPLFGTHLITAMHFLHGWESSNGARQEHEECVKLGIERIYLPQEFSVRVLAMAA